MSKAFRSYMEFQQEFEADHRIPVEPADESQPTDSLDIFCEDIDIFCEANLNLASDAAVQRKQQMQRRLAFVQDLWNDADRFDKIVASGRYLRLCNLTEWISDSDERAWERLKTEVLAARLKTLASR
ncbi:MAG TPA: hypothetical protein VIJ06_06205 [Methylovirgula sp.]